MFPCQPNRFRSLVLILLSLMSKQISVLMQNIVEKVYVSCKLGVFGKDFNVDP
jgi:hypothetical protein